MPIKNYVPILRTKRAEYRALKNLALQNKELITPLFEVRKISPRKDQQNFSLHNSIKKIAKDCVTHWSHSGALLFDTPGFSNDQLTEDQENAILLLYSELKAYQQQVIPVITTERSDALCAKLREFSNSFCFRIQPDDLVNPQDTTQIVKSLMKTLNTSESKCHLLVDLKVIKGIDHDDVVGEISELTNMLEIEKWASLTIASCSFPEDMTGIAKDKPVEISREELTLWETINLSAELIGMTAKFSDYTIINPSKPEIDFQVKGIPSKIRYTDDRVWVIHRSDTPEATEEKYDVYQELSARVMGHTSFKGSEYSWGDSQIDGCFQGKVRRCQLEHWVLIDINHHLTLVSEQISSYVV
ncbi:hypothetical protein BDW_01160 [Bdellovibrio bacteriovorus W]|nr:hypothetical protein BDW_01160 [Bdellovibrio bacteriovorus W]